MGWIEDIVRVLALDYGEKRIGIAVSDPTGMLASAVESYTRRSIEEDIAHILALAREYKAEIILLGWPRNMNGTEGEKCRQVGEFARLLAAHTDIRLDYADERLSTVQAERILIDADLSRKKRRGVIDKMAAVVILQGYLDAGDYDKRRINPWMTNESSN
jgi:putative Holliday junction resolvase